MLNVYISNEEWKCCLDNLKLFSGLDLSHMDVLCLSLTAICCSLCCSYIVCFYILVLERHHWLEPNSSYVFTYYLANKCDSDSDMVFSQQVKLYYTCILLYFCCIRFCNFAVVEFIFFVKYYLYFCHAVVVCMVVLIFILKNTSYQVPPPDGKPWKPGWTNPCRY